MARRWSRPAARVALGASLIGACVLLFTGVCTQALGLGVSVPSLEASVPSLGASVPSVTVSVPSVTVSVPSVEASAPSVTVSVPSVEVPTPGGSVSTPSLSGSTPTVSGSTPTVSVSTPSVNGSTPSTGATEPSAGAGSSGSTSSTSTPTSGGETSSSTADRSAGSQVAPAGQAGTAAAATAAAPSHRPSTGGASGPAKPPSPRAGRAHGRPRHPGGGALAASPVAGKATPTSGSPGALRPARATRRAGHRSSNPLDTIGRHIPLPLPVPDWSKPIILALLALAIWFWVRSRMAARRARRLEAQRATLLSDVGAMQAALVPEVPARVGGLGVSVAYRPADGPAAGGDFYDVFSVERGTVAIILGDVSGHGRRALNQAALTRYTLRAYLQTGLEPRAALALAGRVLADPATEHFATVAAAIYDAREGLLTYASAGHPPPLFRGLRTREPLALCASPPIGWTVPTGRRQTIVSLPPGAVACFFSDGLIEARRDGQLLGRERLDEMLSTLGPRPDASRLLARVRTEASVTSDDMAACILVPQTGLVAQDTHTEELELDAKTLGAASTRRFLEACALPIAEIEQTLARARETIAALGAALVQVQLAPASARASVLAPSDAAESAAGEHRVEPAREPSRLR
jgi:hypothetical protein